MPPSRSTRSTGTDLQLAILDEARRVLLESGYAALSTRRIASAVGCTATSIYLYYASKDALIHALIDEGFVELNRRVLAAARGEDGEPLERMRRAALAYVDFAFERPQYYEVMFMLRPAQMERYPAEAYRRARRPLEVLAEMTGLPEEQALLRGTIAWATLHGLVSLLIAQRVDVRLDREALVRDTVHAACVGALAPLPGDGAPGPTALTRTEPSS
ncbi:MAG: TetR/AcrR family transcriptional regulator [Planctomycetota bacterium]